jgi:hypothetical protein
MTNHIREKFESFSSGLYIYIQVVYESRRRWKDNIKLDFKETGIYGANWIRLAQDRVQWRAFVKTVMNLRFP